MNVSLSLTGSAGHGVLSQLLHVDQRLAGYLRQKLDLHSTTPTRAREEGGDLDEAHLGVAARHRSALGTHTITEAREASAVRSGWPVPKNGTQKTELSAISPLDLKTLIGDEPVVTVGTAHQVDDPFSHRWIEVQAFKEFGFPTPALVQRVNGMPA